MEKLVAESLEELSINEKAKGKSKLKGKQYKIDADKNKKITPNDFKILRGEKKPPKRVNEMADEQIPVEEFDAFVDELIASGDLESGMITFKEFFEEHPYLHGELGEIPGHDKYQGPADKMREWIQEHDEDEWQSIIENHPEVFQ